MINPRDEVASRPLGRKRGRCRPVIERGQKPLLRLEDDDGPRDGRGGVRRFRVEGRGFVEIEEVG